LVPVTAATGVQTVTLNAGLQVMPAPAKQITLRVPVLNLATGLPGVPTGGTLVVSATGLPANLQGLTLTVADVKVDFSLDANSNIRAVVPGSTPLGPTVLKLVSPNGDSIAPILFNVDAQPPVIRAAYDQRDPNKVVFIDALHPAVPGDVILLDVAGLGASTPASVHISVGGVDHIATAMNSVLQFGLISDVTRIQFTLASVLPDGLQQPMTVRVGTRVSAPLTLYVTAPPASAPPSTQK
jgi:uncharacterized protein (TIGR03437 family)